MYVLPQYKKINKKEILSNIEKVAEKFTTVS